MLEYDKIDVNEGIDTNENFNYQKYMRNGCHDMPISIHDLCIGYNNSNAYRINFVFMSKNDALNLIKNAAIIDKKGTL